MDNRELARRLKAMSKQEVGRIMTRLAEPLDLSDYAIARKIDPSGENPFHSTVSAWQSGKQKPQPENFRRYVEALGFTVEEALGSAGRFSAEERQEVITALTETAARIAAGEAAAAAYEAVMGEPPPPELAAAFAQLEAGIIPLLDRAAGGNFAAASLVDQREAIRRLFLPAISDAGK